MKKLIIPFCVVTLLTGCSQSQLSDFTGSVSSTLGSLVSVDTGDGSNKNTAETKGSFTLTLPQDVDSVFAAMVTEFEFPSPEYIKQRRSADYQIIMADGYYHYDTNPGAYYYLGYSWQTHKKETLALKMKLIKSGTGTKITGDYIYYAQSATIKEEIIARIKKALK